MSFLDYPDLLFSASFVLLWLSALLGGYFRRRRPKFEDGESEDLAVILNATLTLLGLLIGFSFSMAISRYDQRKNLEEDEANAIGTEYLRVGVLPSVPADRVRQLLRSYLDRRILFYTSHDTATLARINAATAQLQNELWSVVRDAAAGQPSPLAALAVSGMNDVLNSQGYTQAAWWNRIPTAAWVLLAAIAVCCNLVFGYTTRHLASRRWRLVMLPFIVSISFFLIAELDSPQHGVIRVAPRNLLAVSHSLRAR
jgi:hypothetical protein